MPADETSLISWIRSLRTHDPAAVPIGIGDDMAGLNLAGQGLVLVTTDIRLDTVHFRTAEHSPRAIGRKAFAVSLSDAAAMAALPRAAVCAVALPSAAHNRRPELAGPGTAWSSAQTRELVAGLLELADQFACPLVGGDVTSWAGPLAINVTLLACEAGVRAVRRSGAQPGDAIFVTGRLGGSLPSGRHMSFTPRVAEARSLAGAVELHAMIDISDGLSTDLGHILDESGVGAVLDAGAIPISPAAQGQADPLAAALNDGEDFELCFTCSPADGEKLLAEPPVDVELTRIGSITADRERLLRLPSGRQVELTPAGWQHAV